MGEPLPMHPINRSKRPKEPLPQCRCGRLERLGMVCKHVPRTTGISSQPPICSTHRQGFPLGQGHFALRAGWTNSYSVNCTVPSDSTAAIVCARSDNTGPGQRPVAAIIEVCGRLSSRENTLTLRWVPSHLGVEGDETADGWTRSAAENVGGSVVKTTSAIQASHTWPRVRSAGGELGCGPRRLAALLQAAQRPKAPKELCHEIEALAGCYYQLLLGHAAAGDQLGNKAHRLPSDRC